MAGHPHARVPRLEEAARAVDLTLVVDAKDADGVEAIVGDLERADALGRAIFIGGLAVLVAVRAALPEAPIVLSWPQTAPPETDVLEQVRPRALNLPWEIVDAAAVASVGAQGHEVWTYCVDTARDARRATELGLVGLISNDVPATRGIVEGAA
ncbi:glycerophosphodiester phosphodiesterase [Pseudactinotalea sp.]|uniref:glycerophosphodiester phosphodiesterase n=1 Tax=Pseudactinotalea sp. TaxID=1926260 RepID=UPI003B3ADD33